MLKFYRETCQLCKLKACSKLRVYLCKGWSNTKNCRTCLVGSDRRPLVPHFSLCSWYVNAKTFKSTRERLWKSPVFFANSDTEIICTYFNKIRHLVRQNNKEGNSKTVQLLIGRSQQLFQIVNQNFIYDPRWEVAV